MRMFNPPHPGRQVREDIEALGWTITEAAGYLGCSRKQLSDIANLRSGISPEMAIRLSAIIGGSPGLWCRMQLSYDLLQVEGRTDEILSTVNQPPKEKYWIHDEEGGYFDPPDLKLMLKNASGPMKSKKSVG
jgi:addiction module HigA family antidote